MIMLILQLFWETVYEYSLKEGINDGLTPYKVKRVRTNLDEYAFKSETMLNKES